MLPLYLSVILFSTFAFIGLLGALHKNIEIRTIRGGHLKHKGNKAIVWGILVFLGFGFIPLAVIIQSIKASDNFLLSLCIYTILLVLSLLLALLYRRRFTKKVPT